MAAEWFQKSAEAGNPCSAYALGKLLLEQGQFPQALYWLRQAAEQNDPYAQYRLGKLLLTGAEGVPKDIDVMLVSLTLTDLELSERRRYRGMILTKGRMML